jgi:ABC transporter
VTLKVRQKDPTISDETARKALGALGLTGEKSLRKVGHLSGGEKARVALASFVLIPHNLLLLDEPSNHLDVTTLKVTQLTWNRAEVIRLLIKYRGQKLFKPHHTTPHPPTSYNSIPRHNTQLKVIPYHIAPLHISLHYNVSHHATSVCITSHDIISHRCTPHQIISHHITLSHAISAGTNRSTAEIRGVSSCYFPRQAVPRRTGTNTRSDCAVSASFHHSIYEFVCGMCLSSLFAAVD